MSPSDDLFALIGIDLECDDVTAIKDAMARTRERCSRGSTTGPDKVGCEQLLARLPEIERVLLNPQARAALREEVRKARAEHSEALLKDVSRALTMLLAGGKTSITKLERDALVARYAKAGGLTEAQIDALITVPVGDDAQPEVSRAAPLPASEARLLTSRLVALGCTDLYDFLGVAVDADAVTIHAKRGELSASWNKKAKASAEKGAALELLGKVAILLIDPAKRASYDETLAQAKLEPFCQDIRLQLADGQLSTDKFEALIDTARDTYGLDAAKAEEIIIAEATKRPGIIVHRPSGYTPAPQWQCGVCRTYSPVTSGLCLHCKTPRTVQCPACDAEYESTVGICPGCRGTINDAIWLWRLRDDVRAAIAGGELVEAGGLLAPAMARFPASKTLKSLNDEVAQAGSAQRGVLDEARAMANARRVRAALRLLDKLDAQYAGLAASAELRTRIDGELARAAQLVAAGRAKSGDQAAMLFAQAAEICVDDEAVAAAARSVPPAPPTAATAQQRGSLVAVTWQPSPSCAVSGYLAVRKAGGASLSPDDGQRLDTVPGQTFEDSGAPVGDILYYSVYAVRAGAFSHAAAVARPVVRTAPVTRPVMQAGDGTVTISYTAPPKARAIVVVRSESTAPAGPNDGIRIHADLKRAIDGDVTNGRTYLYSIFAEFSSPGGASFSEPVQLRAVPQTLPVAVKDLRLTFASGVVTAAWQQPDGVPVALLRSDEALGLAPGTPVSLETLGGLGEVLQASMSGQIQHRPPPGDTCFYTAFSVGGGAAVAGAAAQIACVSDIDRLRLVNEAGDLSVSWDWPDSATATIIGWRLGMRPESPDDRAAKTIRVQRQEYQRDGRIVLSGLTQGRYHVAGWACYPGADGEVRGGGLARGAGAAAIAGPLQTISYQLKGSRFGKGYKLVFAGPHDLSLPPLVLVAKPGTFVPTDAEDGEVVRRLDGLSLREGGHVESFPSLPGGRTYRLFFEDELDYGSLQIAHPPGDSLRVK